MRVNKSKIQKFQTILRNQVFNSIYNESRNNEQLNMTLKLLPEFFLKIV